MFDTKLNELRNDGVSPVIGVILMVAITVILAAVIGTFVLGLADDLDQDAQAAVTFDENEGQEVVVQLNSVQSADAVRVEAPVNTDRITGGENAASTGGPDGSYLLNTDGDGGVGTSVTVNTSDESGNASITNATVDDGTITVIGTLDGSDNVIQTYEYVGSA